VNTSKKETSSESPPTLSWHPFRMTKESVEVLWKRLQEFPIVFDDFGKGDFDGFLGKLMHRDNMFFDIGPGLGLACAFAVRPKLDTVLHLVMFDRRLRGREGLFLEILGWLFQNLQLRRCTAMITDGNRTAINLVQRLGFQMEGRMRQSLLQDGNYKDIEIYGMLREEYYASYARYTEGLEHQSAANG
jgi:hypothetical protein